MRKPGPPIVRGACATRDIIEAARAMRHAPTPSERSAWEILRGRRCNGMKWRRQQVIGRFVVDFYCAEHRLALEIDGPVHDAPDHVVRDGERADVLRRHSITVLRIAAEDVSTERLSALLARWRSD